MGTRHSLRSGSLPVLLAASIVLCAAVAPASDWPTYRHDHARTAWSGERLTLPLGLRWVYSAPSPPRKAWAGQDGMIREGHVMVQRVKFDDVFHVAVVGDRVYFGSSVDHRLYCLRAEDGSTAWSFPTDAPIRLAPEVHGDRVLFGSDDGCVYCLEAAGGRLAWKVRPGPADEWLLARGEMISRWPVRTGVLVDGGTAFFGAGIFPHENVYLCAVDIRDGKYVWKQDGISETNVGRSDLSPQGHLLLHGQTLYVPSGGTMPAYVDRASGRVFCKPAPAWRTTAGGPVGGSENLLADDQLYAFGAHHVLALDRASGTTGFGYFTGQQMAVDRDGAYLTVGDEIRRLDRKTYAEASAKRHALELEIYAINRAAKATNASDRIKSMTKARLAALREKVAALAEEGVAWKTACPGTGALIGADNLVIAGGIGNVTALDARHGRVVWQAPVEGHARGLAVAHGALWVSTSAGKIYCFGVQNAAVAAAGARRTAEPADAPAPRQREAARQILDLSGVNRGLCLVLGSESGQLARALAELSALKIYGVEPDTRQAEASRAMLMAAGLYGTRVVIHSLPLDAIPYANYFADLIVSERALLGGTLPDARRIARHLKPCGGVICLSAADPAGPAQSPADWLRATGLGDQARLRNAGSWTLLQRGALPGAGSWTHQYAEPGNTACGDERRVRGGLGVLWYGEPGPGDAVNRHNAAMAPLAMDGRFILQGEEALLAYDAYNGTFLWRLPNPGASRDGAKLGRNPGNLAASDGCVFMVAGNLCHQVDAAAGRVLAVHELPPGVDPDRHSWRYLAYAGGRLLGTAVLRTDIEDKAKRRGGAADSADVVFAIDAGTGKHLWQYAAQSIPPTSIAASAERVFFIDSSLTARQRESLLRQDKSALKAISGEAARLAEARLKSLDVRRAVALDARTGALLWSRTVDVTDASGIGIGGGSLTLMHHAGTLVLGGANANGHYWPQFLAGEFKRRRLVVLDAADGRLLWAKDANYRHRPIIVDTRLIAEPWAFDLRSGQQQTVPHPLTGQLSPWCMMRTGHHCGALAACKHMLTFRTGSTGYYELDEGVGVQHFGGQRPGCWINAIPANGLVIQPEAASGCVCLFSVEATVVMEPRAPRRPWAIASAVGPLTPIRQLAINFGAPGDRRDDGGKLWLAYPRPLPYRQTGLEIALDLETHFLPGGEYTSLDSENTPVAATDTPWLFTSWAQGITGLSVPLANPDDPPARYDVKLHFADLGARSGSARRFDVKVQGRIVPGEPLRRGTAQVRTARGVQVAGRLSIELVPSTPDPSSEKAPLLNALELTRLP